MKNEKEIADLTKAIENQNVRIQSTEKLLKMMIVKGLLREIDESICDSYQRVDSAIEDLLLKEGLEVGTFCIVNGKEILNIIVPENLRITVSKARNIQGNCKYIDDTLEICFCFKALHGNQRKCLLEEQISFCIEGSETHIFI